MQKKYSHKIDNFRQFLVNFTVLLLILLVLPSCTAMSHAPSVKMAIIHADHSGHVRNPIKPGIYVMWDASDDEKKYGITEAEKNNITFELQQKLDAITREPSLNSISETIAIYASITRAEPISPSLNLLSTVALLLPLDRGGVAIDFAAYNTKTQTLIANHSYAKWAPRHKLQLQFKRLAPVQWSIYNLCEAFEDSLEVSLRNSSFQ